MDVSIRYCLICPSKIRMAKNAARLIKSSLGVEVGFEEGPYGSCELVVDGNVVRFSYNPGRYPTWEECATKEVKRRFALAAG